MPFIEKTYRIKAEKCSRAVGGTFNGRRRILHDALHRPDLFSSACPLSASTGPLSLGATKAWLEQRNINGTDEQIEAYYKQHSALALIGATPEDKKKEVKWYIDCGDDDFCMKAIH